MPPRRKPTSQNAKKEQQKLKRAIKRGDIEKPAPVHQARNRKGVKSKLQKSENQETIDKVKKLQSYFLKPSLEYLNYTRDLASDVPLTRPIPGETIVYDENQVFIGKVPTDSTQESSSSLLTCPKRPKWRYDMTKKEVEKNEEGLHNKWLQSVDSHLASVATENSDENKTPSSPTYFERNLEVWRQLWRVTEISSVLCVLVDVRCPLIHLPTSLVSYLELFCSSNPPDAPSDSSPNSSAPRPSRSKRRTKSVVLVLTKTDISTPSLVTAWVAYLKKTYPSWRTVCVHSYHEKEEGWAEQGLNKSKYVPGIDREDRSALVKALEEAHQDLLVKPDGASEGWQPPSDVRKTVDWVAASTLPSGSVIPSHGSVRDERDGPDKDSDKEEEGEVEPDFLTIGLIGQPNVGKSSLLNALFGTSKVRASKTPGKTKHFQTLFLTPEIRIVDCPGLVFPSYARMEVQVLSGILPIARISAVMGCMNWIGERLPFEKVLSLSHPREAEPLEQDKRTWRDGGPAHANTKAVREWTTMDILTSFATKKGWMTAKAGREDVMRAGNAILRATAEGRIKWAFAPSDYDNTKNSHGLGIALPGESELDMDEVESDPEPEESHEHRETDSEDGGEEGESDSEEEEDSDEDDVQPVPTAGRFAALSMGEDTEVQL